MVVGLMGGAVDLRGVGAGVGRRVVGGASALAATSEIEAWS